MPNRMKPSPLVTEEGRMVTACLMVADRILVPAPSFYRHVLPPMLTPIVPRHPAYPAPARMVNMWVLALRVEQRDCPRTAAR